MNVMCLDIISKKSYAKIFYIYISIYLQQIFSKHIAVFIRER